jgi:5-methyltetrahydrofolate--homocysteine methyltransferase
MIQFMDAVRRIKAESPDVHITSGLSNISYGMPARGLINRNFLTLALGAGMDSAIMDPMNRAIMENIYATEALLGQDRFGRRYNKAYRSGLIGAKG